MAVNTRYATLFFAIVENLIFSGIIFGWPVFQLILETEKYFACDVLVDTNSTLHNDSFKHTYEKQLCPKTKHQLGFIFTLATYALTCSTAVAGPLFDLIGTRYMKIIAGVLSFVGFLFAVFASAENSYLIYPAMIFWAVGGYTLFMTNFQIANLFGNKRSTVISFFSGCLDSSAFTFYIVKIFYDFGFSTRQIFVGWTALCGVIIINPLCFLPKTIIPFPLPENWTRNYNYKKPIEEKTISSTDDEISETTSFWSCFTSRLFLLHVMWLSILQLRFYFFLLSVYTFVVYQTDEVQSETNFFMSIFSYALLTGIFWAPLIGLLLDRNKKVGISLSLKEIISDSCLPIALATLMSVCYGITVLIPNKYVQLSTFIFVVFARGFLYACAVSFVGTCFPVQHFGKLLGVMNVVGAFVTLVQFPIYKILLTVPSIENGFFYVNLFFLLLTCLALIHPVHIYFYSRSMKLKPIVKVSLEEHDFSKV